MRVFGIIIGLIAVCIVSFIIWYRIAYPTYTYRYRMTVEVPVDGQVKTGASVIEVRVSKQPKIGSAPAQVSRVRGDAVFVDLGNGRNVIALLASGPDGKDTDYPYNIVPELFKLTLDDRDLVKLPTLSGSRDVPSNYLPTFVTFVDIGNSKSARLVKPNEFENVFGPGTRLGSVRVEMTTQPVTYGIEKSIPKIIETLRDEARTSRSEGRGDPFRVNSGQFERRQ
jgi:hypothetical protein